MKKSKAITLVLITGTVLLGCERDARNRYASWDDCVKDYTDPTKCVEEKDERNPTSRYYYGPWYRGSYSSNPTYNPSATSQRSVGVVRGGFGFHSGSFGG